MNSVAITQDLLPGDKFKTRWGTLVCDRVVLDETGFPSHIVPVGAIHPWDNVCAWDAVKIIEPIR